MHLIAYVSDYINTSDDIDDVLNNIIITSRRNNAELKVTGVLFFMENKFLQILEGEKEDVKNLISRISEDPRHKNFHILLDQGVSKRGFRDWHMESIHLKAGKEFHHSYIEAITSAFENIMVVESDTLAHFYKTFLEEKVMAPSFTERLKNFFFSRRKIMISLGV